MNARDDRLESPFYEVLASPPPFPAPRSFSGPALTGRMAPGAGSPLVMGSFPSREGWSVAGLFLVGHALNGLLISRQVS